MSRNSYSEVVRGARRAPLPQRQVSPNATATAASLAWEPSPASPSPTPQASPTPPPTSAFPSLDGNFDVSDELFQAPKPLVHRNRAAATKGTDSPSNFSYDSHDHDSLTRTVAAEEMVSPPRSREKGDNRVSQKLPEGSGAPLPPSPVPARSASTEMGPNAVLWDKPEGFDLIIRCRPHSGREVHWKVHRHILVDMSEWMEKYMPPEAEDGSVVEWKLSSWDAGQLGAVLQYMYLEDFQGGVYDPKDPLNMESLVLNTVHFLAGTACLCRPMMDQAIDQVDDTTEDIQGKLPLLRLANIDQFELSIRRALLIMYNEPDQWRIRALRIVMGKLMAVCFPLILQNPRWDTYQKWWGMLQVRVVADHKWLYQAGMCQKSDVILFGFENMDTIWVRYRKEGWQPSDDLMFPNRQVEDPPAQAASAPPTPAGGKKKSKAIPIVDPRGNITSVPGMSVACPTSEVKNQPSSQSSESPRSSAAKSTANATSDASPALVQSVPNVEDPFTSISTASCSRRAHGSDQSHTVFPPFSMRPPPMTATSLPVSPQRTQGAQVFPDRAYQPAPVLPWLPDGPFYFAETSTGAPARRFASKTVNSAPPSVVGAPSAMDSGAPSFSDGSSCSTASAATSVVGESSSDSAAASSIDPLDSPTWGMAELNIALDGPDIELADQHATPRAPAGNLSKDHGNFEDLFKDETTPRAPVPEQTKIPEAVSQLATTPTSASANRKNKGCKKNV